MVEVRSGWVCITGNFRENNEDRCLADPAGRFFIVADGMGGQAAGERASEIAIEHVSKKIEKSLDFDKDKSKKVTSTIDEAVAEANAEIMALGKVDPASHNMGTTISFLVSVAGKFYVGGVGDSRVYRLRGGEFDQLTTDHSLTQALIDAGTISQEEAASHRYRNVLYRYLGTKEGSAGTGIEAFEPQSGDRYALCSDGVTDGLSDDDLAELLTEHDDPQAAADVIVEEALDGGSKDNITCVVVHVE